VTATLTSPVPSEASAAPPEPPTGTRALGDQAVKVVVVLVVAALTLIPLGFLVYGSLSSDGPGAPDNRLSLDNWRYALGSEGRRFLGHTVQLGLITAVCAIVLGTALAWLIARCEFRGRRALGTLLMLPLLFSPLLSTLSWIGLADPQSGLLNLVGGDVFGSAWPRLNIYSMWGMVLILSMHYTPYVYLAVRPVMAAIDRNLEDSAAVLGARGGRTLATITLPLVVPAVVASGLLVFVLSADEFNVASILGVNAHFLTIPYGVYESFAGFPPNPGRSASLGLVLMVVTVLGMTVYLRMMRRTSRFVTVTGKSAVSARHRLRPAGTVLAIVLSSLYLLISVGLPYAMLLLGSFSKFFTVKDFSWSLLTLDNYRKVVAAANFAPAMRNTVVLAVLAATVVTVFGALCAWVSHRLKGALGKAVDYLVALPIMIPGIAFGLGLLYAYIYLPGGLYGTVGVLLLAYVTRFLGHGSRVNAAGLMQISGELEDAARMLGRSRVRAFASTTLPMLRNSLGSAWILVAVFSSLEIPASIFLYSGSSAPGSVLVYLAMQDGVVSQAFALGAILASGVFVLCVIAQWRFKLFRYL
jgi:iron(III) transport system permease protein